MRTLVLDGIFVYKDLEPFFNNERSIDLIFKKAQKNGFERFILIQNGFITNVPEGIKNVVIKDKSPKSILETILKEAKNTEDITIVNVGNPFYDVDFTAQLLERHEKYIADYTYGLGYPDGLSPSIIRKDIIKELIPLIENDGEIKKDYLFYAISKDINSFDIETILSDIDLRIYRISFGCADIGEEIFTLNLYNEFSGDLSIDEIVQYLNKNTDKFFTTIYLLILEITNYSKVGSLYYPEIKESRVELSIEKIKKFVDRLAGENSNLHVILGGLGDPLEHPDFFNIVKYITDKNLELIVESNGYNIDDSFVEKLKNIPTDKITFVIKVDSYHEESYKMIHPEGNFGQIKNNIRLLKEAGYKIYRQITRMNENEVEIENYIRNKDADNLIIRKYSTFCDMIPDRKVVDLAPLERIPCFHLRREIFIRSDGNITPCLYSRFKEIEIGNINDDSINVIDVMNRMNELYVDNSKKNYLEFCKKCNDYYIFNF